TCALPISTSLIISKRYYVRVFSKSNSFPSSNAGFQISVKHIAPPPPPSNDECAGATTITSNTTCSNTSSTLISSTKSFSTVTGCESALDHYDVWFKFTAAATNQTISSSVGAGITNPAIQLYGGTCGSLTSLQCGTTSITNTSLTIRNTYYVRVSQVGSVPSGTVTFTICVTHPAPPPAPPANDECSSATSLTVGTTNNSGTVWGATESTGIVTGCATGTPDDDVWYRFTAPATTATVTLSSIGGNLSTSGARVQAFSGACGSLISIGCSSTDLNLTGLSTGTQYYLRVYSAGAGSIGGLASGSAISINVSGPPTLPSTNYQGSRMKEVFKQTTL